MKPRYEYIYHVLSKKEANQLIQNKTLKELYDVDDKEFVKLLPNMKINDYWKFKEQYLNEGIDDENSNVVDEKEFENVIMKTNEEINPIEEFRESEKRFSRNYMHYKFY